MHGVSGIALAGRMSIIIIIIIIIIITRFVGAPQRFTATPTRARAGGVGDGSEWLVSEWVRVAHYWVNQVRADRQRLRHGVARDHNGTRHRQLQPLSHRRRQRSRAAADQTKAVDRPSSCLCVLLLCVATHL
jgi:hypothetical protein